MCECLLCSYILLIRVMSTMCVANNAQAFHLRPFFPPSLVLWALSKHLGCCFPWSVSGVVPLTCVVHSCTPPRIRTCLSYPKKKNQEAPPRVVMSVAVVGLISAEPNKPSSLASFGFHQFSCRLKVTESCFLGAVAFELKFPDKPSHSWR